MNVFFVILGIVIGLSISQLYTNWKSEEMAPIDNRYHELEGVMLAYASKNIIGSVFYINPTKDVNLSERFALTWEHKDLGIYSRTVDAPMDVL